LHLDPISSYGEETRVSSFLFLSMHPLSRPHSLERRQERLRQLLERRKLPLLLVSNPVNIFYLTGFRGSAGVAILGPSEAFLWVDPRYTQQAREQARGVEVVEERGSLLKAAGRCLGKMGVKKAGYEDGHLTCAGLRELAGQTPGTVRLTPAGGLVEELRYVKDPEEIECIRNAGWLTAAVLAEVIKQVRPGVRECDLAAEIDYRLRRRGADGAAFETIVASGPRAAWPHARASAKLLKKSELVIFDLGAILRGYAADMTRTFYLGNPSRRVRSLYSAVLEAQQRAVRSLGAGKRARDVDAAARRALAARGLDGCFTHSTGHGVGLEIHEKPRLARGEQQRLEAGCVVAVEPGVYLEGLGGIRIEDTVLVRRGGGEILTPAPKDDWIIM
jgi:Xaa-Pro aminopeptidase